MEPKVGNVRDDLAGLRGRLAGSQLPDSSSIEVELRDRIQPKLGRAGASVSGTHRGVDRQPAVRAKPEPREGRASRDGRRVSDRKPRGRRSRSRGWLVVTLTVATVISLAAAYAQVRVDRQVRAGTVLLAVDVSRSMDATDVAPDRLTAAVTAARAFLDRLPSGFRVGLVTFSNRAVLVVPPTSDRSRLSAALTTLTTPSTYGTVIGDGLATSVGAVLDDRAAGGDRPAAIVLLSDGQDSGSVTAPDLAADRAAGQRIPVFTVAIGTTSGATGGSPSEDGGALLRRIADATGARAFTTSTAGQLTQVYATLGSRLSYELAIGNDAGAFVIAAVVLAVGAAILMLLGQRDPYDALAAPSRPLPR